MMSKNFAKITLVVAALCSFGSCRSIYPEFVDCEEEPGAYMPVDIYNSMYYLDSNDEICCPPGPNDCIPIDRVSVECEKLGRGITYEPCGLCFTCAKLRGENCAGIEGVHGRCDEGLVCDGSDEDEEGIGACAVKDAPPRQLGEECGGRFDSLGVCDSGLACVEVVNGTGMHFCVMADQHQMWNESCGGRYGALGRCNPNQHLRCSAPEDRFMAGEDISGTCYGITQKPACFTDCSTKPEVYVCATDGLWYRHKCYYRKKNCGLREKDWIRKTRDSVCGQIPSVKVTPPPITEATQEEKEEEISHTISTKMVTTEDISLRDTDTTTQTVETEP